MVVLHLWRDLRSRCRFTSLVKNLCYAPGRSDAFVVLHSLRRKDGKVGRMNDDRRPASKKADCKIFYLPVHYLLTRNKLGRYHYKAVEHPTHWHDVEYGDTRDSTKY